MQQPGRAQASWHRTLPASPGCDARRPAGLFTWRVRVQAAGKDTTSGIFDEPMYRYAISPEAQESHHVSTCYDVLHRQ